MDEFASIRHWTSGRQGVEWQKERGVVLGIGDDAALIDPSAPITGVGSPYEYIMAMDTMVETVHFNEVTMSYEDVGYKALAANVSDIAAMGGVPLQALISVSVPRKLGPEPMRRLYDGLYACAERYGIAIIGGDTTSSPQHLVIAVTVTGVVEAGKGLRRSGAKPGDAVVLTGPVGKSAAGLHFLLAQQERGLAALAGERAESLVQAHRRPSPSVRAGRLLLTRGTCHSLNDVSDGLASEAWEIAEASGLLVCLREQQIPRSGSMAAYAGAAGIDPLEWMLYGGEDYVLLGTMESSDAIAAQADFHAEGLPFYIIGETLAAEPGVELIRTTDKGELRMPLVKRGYNHFE